MFRRSLLKCALGSTLLSAAPRLFSQGSEPSTTPVHPKELRGSQFELNFSPLPVNYTGKPGYATAINQSLPAPTLRWKEGERVRLKVSNSLAEEASIHWHGIILPASQDGVPHISENFHGIHPGESFTYEFPVLQSGTYWYHSHSGFQEQTGAFGAIIIDPKEPDSIHADRDYVVLLSDWSDEQPTDIFKTLKKVSHYYNTQPRTLANFFEEVQHNGLGNAWANRKMWNEMRMSDRDISDVTGMTYTFLMNGNAPATGWTGLFSQGETIRLRFINGSAMTFFDVRIPGLEMKVIAADGQNIEPVTVDEFRMGVAETYDVLVRPSSEQAYSIFAQAIDRTGYALGTLTPSLSIKASPPILDALPLLTHQDMGMNMQLEMPGHKEHNIHAGHDMSAMNHSQHSQMQKPKIGSGVAGYGSARKLVFDATGLGPEIDMVAEDPQFRLDDPGVGLRNNGRRVLTYADLRNRYHTPDPREPGREIDLHLTGNMERYIWSINGVQYKDAEPIPMKYGERLRVNLINNTMMNHPIHLHGMWSDLETGDARQIPRKHTVIVQPGAKISYLVTADALGRWAYHCHLLYHMGGMFREVVVSR